MALSTTNIATAQTEAVPAAHQPGMSSSDAAVLMMAALAGVSMTKTARRQYRKMTRKMAWKAMGQKIKAGLGFKTSGDIPETVMGMNFWVFLAVAVGAVILGTVIFGITGFLILLGIAIIIYLLLNGK